MRNVAVFGNCDEKVPVEVIADDIDPDTYISVLVSHVNSPGNFYLQLGDGERGSKLEELMDMLEQFYRTASMFERFSIKEGHVQISMAVAALYSDGNWHRAKVLDVNQPAAKV